MKWENKLENPPAGVLLRFYSLAASLLNSECIQIVNTTKKSLAVIGEAAEEVILIAKIIRLSFLSPILML